MMTEPKNQDVQTQNAAKTAITAYQPKRLHTGELDASVLSQLLTYLTTIEDNDRIAIPFSSLFEQLNVSELRYTEHSAWEGDDQSAQLFRSDIALLFYDLLVSLNLTEEKILSGKFEELAPNNGKANGQLIDLIKNFGTSAGKTMIYEEGEKRLNELFTTGNIRVISRFFLDYLAQAKAAKPEEEKVAEGGGAAQQAAETPAAELPTAGVPTVAGETQTEGAEAATVPGRPAQPQPTDVLELKRQLFSPEIREQAARFTQIGLVQLEHFHGLPAGSLQNSKELKEILSQKSMSFFATVLSENRFNLLISSPEERFKFAREYIWLMQNDFRTKIAITKHLEDVVLKNADPAAKAAIEQALAKEDPSELIKELAENPQLQTVLKDLQALSPAFQKNASEYLSEIDQELLQSLKDIGVQTDKIPLAQTNVINIIDAMITMRLPLDVLKYLDEPRFRIIFGEDIPYRPEFIQEFLTEYWQARQSALGKKYGELLLTTESRFAIQEALEILNKNNTQGISEKQSDAVFNEGIARPLNEILVAHRATGGLPVESTLEAAYSKKTDPPLKERYQAYLRSRWTGFTPAERAEILAFFGYGEPASQGVVNLSMSVEFIPPQMGIIDLSPILSGGEVFYSQDATGPAFESEFMPDNAEVHSPLGGVRGLREKLAGFRDLGKNARGLGKGLQRLLGKKATEKAAAEIAGKAAGAVGTAVGTPLAGAFMDWLAKNMATKEGRTKLALGLGAMLIPLTSLGGWLGGALGGIAGWFLGGPAGLAIGSIGGSWLGFGIEQGIKNSLGGDGSAAIGFSGPGNIFGGGGGGGGGGAAAPASSLIPRAGGPVATVMATGTQAVLATVGLVAGGSIFTHLVLNNALLADFPQVDPLSTTVPGAQGKVSEFVTIEKRVFITGCPENKCENPAFPIEAEYSIIIRPKGNHVISLSEVVDTLRVNHSAKAWEEKGRAVPNIPEKIRSINDFPELYEGLVINPGEEFAFSYTESFDGNYNDATILNTFEMKFGYTDAAQGKSGEDSAITGEVIYVGDYSQGAGCWPTSGTITQLPGGSFSHSQTDAFDISNIEGTPVYAPFAGQICVGGKDSAIYGNHLILSAGEGQFIFGHFRQLMIRGCQGVSAGDTIGLIGNTGASTGPHLHFGMLNSSPRPWPTALALLMPDGPGTQEDDPVRSCYD